MSYNVSYATFPSLTSASIGYIKPIESRQTMNYRYVGTAVGGWTVMFEFSAVPIGVYSVIMNGKLKCDYVADAYITIDFRLNDSTFSDEILTSTVTGSVTDSILKSNIYFPMQMSCVFYNNAVQNYALTQTISQRLTTGLNTVGLFTGTWTLCRVA